MSIFRTDELNPERNLTASEILALQDRWKTAEGLQVKVAILESLRAGKLDWPDFLADLPKVSTHTPYPEVLDDLRGLMLCREMLDGVSMSFSDLSFSIFDSCSLNKASFQGCKLNWANFTGSQMQQADLLQVVADHSIFDDCDLSGAMMLSGDYRHGSFKNAALRRCVLNGCRFLGCDLSGTDFTGAESHNLDIAIP